MVTMPVAPGRTVATLVEVAARNELLRARGVHTARDFAAALDARIARANAPEGADDADDLDTGGSA
jgi:HPr kinase/phosphorylase